jgi:hypothetical protein
MSSIDRRSFMKTALAAPVVSTLGLQDAVLAQNEPVAAPASFPCGKVGSLQISRLLLGGNLLTHFTHSRDLKYVYTLTANYNTDDKIVQTLRLAEQHGVNTLVVHTVPHVIGLLANYRKEQGGKMQWIVCPTAQPDSDRDGYIKQVEELVAEKCEAIYLWGVSGDRLTSEKKIDAIKDAVAIAHDAGVPSGVGAHDLNVIRYCEENNVPADFYIKTFHHHNYPSGPKPEEIDGPHAELPGYWCREPKDTIEAMAAVEKPWFAFKVMAAGAIPPQEAFHYAYENGADHILAGMFDFEIAQDVEIAKDALALTAQRERPWRS